MKGARKNLHYGHGVFSVVYSLLNMVYSCILYTVLFYSTGPRELAGVAYVIILGAVAFAGLADQSAAVLDRESWLLPVVVYNWTQKRKKSLQGLERTFFSSRIFASVFFD